MKGCNMDSQSKLDATKKLHTLQCVLTIVKHGDHASFLLEELQEDASYAMRKIHFIPRGADPNYYYAYGGTWSQVITNEIVPGEVNERSVVIDGKSLAQCSRVDFFTQLKLEKFQGVSFEIPRAALCKMMEVVRTEKSKPPGFNIKGKLDNNGVAHNCCTWIVEKAALINIDARVYLQSGFIAYWLQLPILPEESEYENKASIKK